MTILESNMVKTAISLLKRGKDAAAVRHVLFAKKIGKLADHRELTDVIVALEDGQKVNYPPWMPLPTREQIAKLVKSRSRIKRQRKLLGALLLLSPLGGTAAYLMFLR